MQLPQRNADLTESEAVAVLLLVFAAAVMTIGWIADGAGIPIEPFLVLVVSLASFVACWRLVLPPPAPFAVSRLGGLLVVTIGSAGYILWLSWPSFFPASEGPDLVHHLMLIHFIQQRHALPPHDGSFGAYLGEMNRYSPGSHLLAAIPGEWFRTDALRLVQPILALVTGLKAAMIYCILLRVSDSLQAGPASTGSGSPRSAGPPASHVIIAVAGTLLLFVPHAYLLTPIAKYGFYAQVVAESFALAMLWTLVAWCQAPSPRWLWLFSTFGLAVVLCWPVLSAVPLVALVVTVWSRAADLRHSLADLARGAAVPSVGLGIFTAASAGSAGVLASGGSVLSPGVSLFGWPFLILATAGLAAAVRRRDVMMPILGFTLGCVVQIAGLAWIQHALHATNLYLALKTVHLLVYPVVVLAGSALAFLVSRHIPSAWILLLAVGFWITRGGLPSKPLTSPLTPEAFAAGTWARDHVPPGCIDYLFPHWLTGYWLHYDVLGNPRHSERTRTESFDYREVAGHWIEPGSLKYAIVGALDRLPTEARANMRIVQQFGPAAVVERRDGTGTCPDAPPPIRDVPIRRRP